MRLIVKAQGQVHVGEGGKGPGEEAKLPGHSQVQYDIAAGSGEQKIFSAAMDSLERRMAENVEEGFGIRFFDGSERGERDFLNLASLQKSKAPADGFDLGQFRHEESLA